MWLCGVWVDCDAAAVNVSGRNLPEDEKLYEGPTEIEGAALRELSGARSLRVHNTRVRHVPGELGALCDLRSVRLLGNPLLEELPDSVAALGALEVFAVEGSPLLRGAPALRSDELVELTLSGCGLRQLPEYLGPRLQRLHAPGNRLRELPLALAQQSRLVSLNLDNNQLERVEALAGMTGLKVLSLSGNLLREDIFDSLPCGLDSLALDRNRVAKVPAALCRLTALRYVSMKNNLVTAVHPAVFCMLLLHDLNLDGNPLHDPVFSSWSKLGSREVGLNPDGENLLEEIRKAYLGVPGVTRADASETPSPLGGPSQAPPT